MEEAVSSLIFASSRTKEFPELQELRVVFASCFSKEFLARSVELRDNCGVNIKLSTRRVQQRQSEQPQLEEELDGTVGDIKRKYKDVADVAQEAFQSAANAAEATKVAVDLSCYRPPDNDNNVTRDILRNGGWKNKEISALSKKALSYTK